MQLVHALVLLALPFGVLSHQWSPGTEAPALSRRMIRTGAFKFGAAGKAAVDAIKSTPATGGGRTFSNLAFAGKAQESYAKQTTNLGPSLQAAKDGLKHMEKTQNWPANADYSFRSGIHGPDPKNANHANYFPNNPGTNWLTLQREHPSQPGKTQAVHLPVDGQNKFDPNVKPYIVGANKNKGSAVVPGTGSLMAQGSGTIPLRRRALDARIAYNADLLHELVRRAAEAEAEAFRDYDDLDLLDARASDLDMDLYEREAEPEASEFDEGISIFDL